MFLLTVGRAKECGRDCPPSLEISSWFRRRGLGSNRAVFSLGFGARVLIARVLGGGITGQAEA